MAARNRPTLGPVALVPAREAVAGLVHEYSRRLDAGDLDGVADLFARASWRSDRGSVRRGAEEVRRAYDPVVLYDGVPRTKHVITNLRIDADGRRARSRCYFTVVQAPPGRPPEIVLAGRYHDEFASDDGRWHFTDRLILADLVGNLRWHMGTGR